MQVAGVCPVLKERTDTNMSHLYVVVGRSLYGTYYRRALHTGTVVANHFQDLYVVS